MLDQILALNIFGFFLIFARVGTALMLMPGFGAVYVPVQMRLGLALAISFAVAPVLMGLLPARPAAAANLAILVAGEILIGAFLGVIAAVIISALQTAGTIIAYAASMANALIQDPIAEQQSSTIAGFLLVMGIAVVFVADLHHLMLRAVFDSYTLMAPGAALPVGDIALIMGRRVADSFSLGLRLSAPFVIVGLTYYIGLGFLGRLMPQLQVFFFGLPFQIGVQIWVLAITVTGIIMAFMQAFGDAYQGFIVP